MNVLKEKKLKISIVVYESETEGKKSTKNIYFKGNFASNRNQNL